MFGYVKAFAPELKVREQEYYRGTYCGLCRTMGKCTGQCSRLSLSYDFAFLALVRILISGEKPEFEKKICPAHPLKRTISMKRSPQLDYCAYAAALLSYHKLKDDINDEKGAHRMIARFLMPEFSAMRRRSLRRGGLSDLDSAIKEQLVLLGDTEKKQEKSVDRPAQIFGNILSDIVSGGFEGTNKKIAASIGLHIGRWIYITDALDDMADDMKKQRYNPFLLLYGGMPPDSALNGISDALKNELSEAEKAFDLIDCTGNRDAGEILKNIIYLGMPGTVEKIVAKYRTADTAAANAAERKDDGIKSNE